ncbi:MAG: C10 family peptidase [Bacteroides sp.]|nr:C10 family peptidase [Bacteroides sp.]
MKKLKTLIVLGAILLPTAISAKSLNADEAKQIAADFIRDRGIAPRQSRGSASTPLQLTLATQGSKISRAAGPAYYIFNISDNNGYVIVSGDDSFNEILGYADSGNYRTDNVNPAMEFWLNNLAAEMATPPTKNSNPSRATVTMTDVAPLLKTTWNQLTPYNNECWVDYLRPTIGQQPQHAPTGCVATAMAQVINYHQWPQNYKDFEYKWDLMLPSYNGTESAESIDQVAKLMKHCGTAVGMRYGSAASGAPSQNIAPALVNDFGYDGSKIQYLEYNSLGKERMHALLNDELKEGRPVLVAGEYPQAVDEGHQFIFDGCTSDGFFHVNWGWGGYLDGYFRITSLRPEDYGTGGAQQGYSFNVSMITGIQPKKNIDPTSGLRAKIKAMGDLRMVSENAPDTVTYSYSGYYSPTFYTSNGQNSGFINIGTSSFTGYDDYFQTKWTRLSTGEISIKGEKYYVSGIAPGYYTKEVSFFNRDFNPELVSGEKYEVSLVYHLSDDEEGVYHDVEFEVGRRSSVILERIGDSLRYIHPRMPILLKASLPSIPDRIQIKGNQTFSVDFNNTSEQEYVGEAKCMFKDSEGNIVANITDYVMLDLLPGEKITENLTLYNLGNAKAGTYTVGLYDFRNNLISDTKTVELYEYVVSLDETNFPDPVFRNYLASNYDRDRDGVLSPSELNNANVIQVNGLGIVDFKGCELLPNLSFVEIINEKCTEIDLSNCGPIYYMAIYNTPLEKITLGTRKGLEDCHLHNNKLKELDLSGCKNVKWVSVQNNQLNELPLSGLENIQTLSCGYNNLTNLDLTGLTGLTNLYCSSNKLTSLNVNGLTNLKHIEATNNMLSGKLDVSGLRNLEYLVIWENTLSELILGDHPNLKTLSISSNRLTGKLDISNYRKIELCSAGDNSFSEFLAGDNKALTYLDMSYNHLRGRVDVSAMENLEIFNVSGNLLEDVIFKNNHKLHDIVINENKLTGKIDLSSFDKLTYISASNNELSEIILGEHPKLEYITAHSNKLGGTFDFSKCPQIKSIGLESNQINEIILGNNPELTSLGISSNQVLTGTLDISGAPNLQYLSASGNKITDFKYANHPNLSELYIYDNSLTHFHLEDFPSIHTYRYDRQKADITIDTPNFNLKTLASTGFDPNRNSEWTASWAEGDGLIGDDCSMINGVVVIPERAGRDVVLRYKYLTDVTTNQKTEFTINLTREGFTAIDDIMADSTGEITVEGNTIHTGADCMKEVFNISGQCIYRGTDESITIDGGRGIYLIRIADKTAKIAI